VLAMPITKGAKKALRASSRKQVFNTRRKKAIEEVMREIKKALKAKDAAKARGLLPKAYQAIDKAAKEHTLDKNTASRKKSRLSKLIKNSK
jgi:small subunit ribosomal protein S20